MFTVTTTRRYTSGLKADITLPVSVRYPTLKGAMDAAKREIKEGTESRDAFGTADSYILESVTIRENVNA